MDWDNLNRIEIDNLIEYIRDNPNSDLKNAIEKQLLDYEKFTGELIGKPVGQRATSKLFAKYIKDIAPDSMSGSFSDTFNSIKNMTDLRQNNLYRASNILNKLKQDNLPLHGFSFAKHGDPYLNDIAKKMTTGTDAQKLMMIFRDQLKIIDDLGINEETLFAYAGNKDINTIDKSIEFGLKNNIWNSINKSKILTNEQTKVLGILQDANETFNREFINEPDYIRNEEWDVSSHERYSQGQKGSGSGRLKQLNDPEIYLDDTDKRYLKEYDATREYTERMKLYGDAYGQADSPTIKKMSLATTAVNQIDDLYREIEFLNKQKSNTTSINKSILADKIARLEKEANKIARDVEGKFGIKPKRIQQITRQKKANIDKATGKVLISRTGQGKSFRALTDKSNDFKRALALDSIINTKEYGRGKITGVNMDMKIPTASFKSISINPTEFAISIDELSKSGKKQTGNQFRSKDLITIKESILKDITKSKGVLFNIEGKVSEIITPESVDKMMGNYKSWVSADRIARMKESVIGTLHKHAGWALYSSDVDKTISIANEAYIETLKSMKNIDILGDKQEANLAEAVLTSFSEEFNGKFLGKFFSAEETGNLFKGNHILDKLLDEYHAYPEYRNMAPEVFLKQSIDAIQADRWRFKGGQKMKPMSMVDIKTYLNEKYAMSIAEDSIGWENLRDAEIEDIAYNRRAVPKVEMSKYSPEVYARRAFAGEMRNIAVENSIYDIRGLINKKSMDKINKAAQTGKYMNVSNVLNSLQPARGQSKKNLDEARKILKSSFDENMNNLHNKIKAARTINGQISDDIISQVVNMFDLEGAGIFSAEDMKIIISNPEEYLGYSSVAFEDENVLRRIIQSVGDLNVTRSGQEYQLKYDEGLNEIKAFNISKGGKYEGIVGQSSTKYIEMASNDLYHITPEITPTMTEQVGIELYNNSGKMYNTKYLSHTPTASIQALRDIISEGQFVALDYETTGLPGAIDNELLIPTEIYATKQQVNGDIGNATFSMVDEYHKYVKPTDAVKNKMNSIMAMNASEIMADESSLWMLKNYAKYTPGLAQADKELFARYARTGEFAESEISTLISHAKSGMDFLETKGSILSDAMIGVSEYTKNEIIVGQNVADADEIFRKFGIDNALKTTEDNITKQALERARMQKNKLTDLMHVFFLLNPEEEFRNLDRQATRYGVDIGAHHLGKDDTLATVKILNREFNDIANNKTALDIINNPEKFALKEGDIIAKIYGASTDPNVTQGVYKFHGIDTTDGRVSALITKYGEDGMLRVNADSMTELQYTLGREFARVSEDEITDRMGYYEWDRTRSNISKAISNYDQFMVQKENAMYAIGGESRANSINQLRKAQRRYSIINNKLKLAEIAKDNDQIRNLITATKEELRTITDPTEWENKNNYLNRLENQRTRISTTVSSMIDEMGDLTDKEKSSYNKYLTNSYKKIKAAIWKNPELSTKDLSNIILSEKDKIALSMEASISGDPTEVLENKIEKLQNTYTDEFLSPERMKIYEGTSSWYNSKEADKLEKAFRKVKALSSIDTYGLNNEESARLLKSINNQIKENRTATKKHDWVKSIGTATLPDGEGRALYVDTSSVTRIEQSISGITKGGIKLSQIESVLRESNSELINDTINAKTSSSLANYIYANKDKLQAMEIKDITVNLSGQRLDETFEEIDKLINSSIYDKYSEVSGGRTIAKKVLSKADEVSSKSSRLGLHYMTPSIGMTGIDAKNAILNASQDGLVTLDDMLNVAKSYQPIDRFGIIKNARETFKPWKESQGLKYGQQYQMLRGRFNELIESNIANKLEGINEYAKEQYNMSREAWRDIAKIATEDIGSINDEALGILNWKPLSDSQNMSLGDMRSQLMTEGTYAGMEFSQIPEKELMKYIPNEYKTGKLNTRDQLGIRVQNYFDELKRLNVQHLPDNAVLSSPFAPTPGWVNEELTNIYEELNKMIRPTLSNESARLTAQEIVSDALTRGAGEVSDTQPAINIINEVFEKSANKFSGKMIAAVAGAGIIAGALAGGTRFSPVIPGINDQEEERQKTRKAQSVASQHSRAGSRIYQDSYDVNITGRSNKQINTEDFSSNMSNIMNNDKQDININVREDRTKITDSWLEEQFIKLL